MFEVIIMCVFSGLLILSVVMIKSKNDDDDDYTIEFTGLKDTPYRKVYK